MEWCYDWFPKFTPTRAVNHQSKIFRGSSFIIMAKSDSSKCDTPEIQKAIFAEHSNSGSLEVCGGERSIHMHLSDGTGEPLLRFNSFGADIIRFPADGGVGLHVHEGDHILFVLYGRGVVVYASEEHELYPGLCYLIPGSVEHAIRASEELVLVAVGNIHRPLESMERLTPISK